jgi:hypothetical protein
MTFIRPEVTDLIWRAREVIWAGLVVALGFWLVGLGGYVLVPLGFLVGGVGLVLAATAWRRMRFEQAVEAPGLVELDEAFANLPGMDTAALVAALEPSAAPSGAALSLAAETRVIWRRAGKGVVARP